MAVARVCVPRVSSSYLLPLQEALQNQQVGLIWTPIILLLLPWVPQHVRFLCVPIKGEASISPNPLELLKLSSTSLQSQMLWGLVFSVQDPVLRSPMWGLDISLSLFFFFFNFSILFYLLFYTAGSY